jgi:hypothetical protein
MHSRSFQERFKSKNTPQSVVKQPKPKRERHIGAPWEFYIEVCRRTRSHVAHKLALYIYHRTCVLHCQTVTLPADELAAQGILRQTKQKALTALQTVGLIEVEHRGTGRAAKITLLNWREER